MQAIQAALREAEEPATLYAVHGHYADAGEIAALMAHTLGVPMVLTGHSLGRNKLDSLKRQGTLSADAIEVCHATLLRGAHGACGRPCCCAAYRSGSVGCGAICSPVAVTCSHDATRVTSQLDSVPCTSCVRCLALQETYRISRRIEAEERALDAALMVITSTQQEVDLQWGLYDGYRARISQALRLRAIAGHAMPELHVIPPGLDFSTLRVRRPAVLRTHQCASLQCAAAT